MMELMQTTPIYGILDTPIGKSKLRSSPRPLIYLCDSADEDEFTIDVEDQPNNSVTYHRPSLSSIYSGFYRTKSRSVKLAQHDLTNSCAKKGVHFADEFGLALSQTKMIDTDEVPSMPDDAFKHLHVTYEHYLPTQERMKVITYMEPQFINSMYTQDFYDRVYRQKILLEQANAIDNRIYGTVRLVSLGLQKRVKICLTADNWTSFQDYDAQYITNSYDGTCARFSFTIEIDCQRICAGDTIQFCICYEFFGGPEYWDNNSEQNYRFSYLSRTIPENRINHSV